MPIPPRAYRVDDAFFIHHRWWWMGKASATRPDPPYDAADLAHEHRIYGNFYLRGGSSRLRRACRRRFSSASICGTKSSITSCRISSAAARSSLSRRFNSLSRLKVCWMLLRRGAAWGTGTGSVTGGGGGAGGGGTMSRAAEWCPG